MGQVSSRLSNIMPTASQAMLSVMRDCTMFTMAAGSWLERMAWLIADNVSSM